MPHATLVRWFCRFYRILLYAYPRDFRLRYGREMAQVFTDHCRTVAQTQGLRGLLRLGAHSGADWLITTSRERIASMHPPPQAAAQTLDGVPGFYTCESYSPRAGALVHGGVLSLAAFSVVSFAMAHSGDPRLFQIGSYYRSRSHFLQVRTPAAASTELNTEIRVKPDGASGSDVWSNLLSLLSAPVFPVLRALDADRDGVVSASEIANAPVALRTLDRNHDGELSPEECGLSFVDPRNPHPVFAALDADHNGAISASEIQNASVSLKTLDSNGDGKLSREEVLSRPR